MQNELECRYGAPGLKAVPGGQQAVSVLERSAKEEEKGVVKEWCKAEITS